MIIEPTEWGGTYQMNHDSWVGKLWIYITGLNYTDQNGQVHHGSIVHWSQGGQHLKFNIRFPNNTQTFDAYMFSWDKKR